MSKTGSFSLERWYTLTLAEQLGNVGSDYERALRWKAKGNKEMFDNAAARTLEQLDMTVSDTRLQGSRRKEIARVRQTVCDELFSQSNTPSGFERYFMYMALLARR